MKDFFVNLGLWLLFIFLFILTSLIITGISNIIVISAMEFMEFENEMFECIMFTLTHIYLCFLFLIRIGIFPVKTKGGKLNDRN